MSFCKSCKELYGVNQKGSCPLHAYLTPGCVGGGAHAVPDSTVANLYSAQFNHFDSKCDEECEYFFRKRLLTCVDTIWPGVIHVATVGMVLLNARVIKIPDLTLMTVKAVMKMCFSQGPVMLAQIPPSHETIILCVAVLFLWFIWHGFFCPLFKPILCFVCMYVL